MSEGDFNNLRNALGPSCYEKIDDVLDYGTLEDEIFPESSWIYVAKLFALNGQYYMLLVTKDRWGDVEEIYIFNPLIFAWRQYKESGGTGEAFHRWINQPSNKVECR